MVHNPVGDYSPIFVVAEAAADDGEGDGRASPQQQAQRRGEEASNRWRKEEESALLPCRKPLLCSL